MDQLLSKAGSTLVTFAVRSGVQVASTYVIKSVSTLMDHVPEHERKKLERKKDQLQNKIETVTYTIEIIQLMAAKGNSSLESVLKLADYLKEDIETFSNDIDLLTTTKTKNGKLNSDILKVIEKTIDELVDKIDNIIPILNLVLTTYGTSDVHNFQNYVSPGRLLNSTVIVNNSNEEFDKLKGSQTVNVGPKFSLTFYNIFYNHSAAINDGNQIIWREKFACCSFQIVRVPNKTLKYSYELKIIEDFNDERYHDKDENPDEKVYDIRQIAKLFFSASGRLLKLEDRSTPVLVLKIRKTNSENTKKLTEDSDFEWIAVGDYETSQSDSEKSEDEDEGDEDEENDKDSNTKTTVESKATDSANVKTINTKGMLSLLEYLIRLCSLQANDQISLLDVKDERLRQYLSDDNNLNNVSEQISSLSKKMENLKL
jgi:hypothetical protein